jgi:acyl-CoA synthetase (AMP-forming)/AMP-acid ligase II
LRFLDRRERETWVPWSGLLQAASRVAGGLRDVGVVSGDNVVLVYPTQPEFFEAFFGILMCGAVPVPIYPPMRLGRLDEFHRRTARMIRAVGAPLVLCGRKIRRLVGEGVARANPRLGCRILAELPSGSRFAAKVGPEDLALIQFSSGTTVDPKPVMLTHRAVMAQVRALNGYWPDTPSVQHSGVSWLPLYHDMGLIGCVFPAMERPADLTLIPPEVFVSWPAVWLRAISRYGATVSPAPNFAYGLCVDKVQDEELRSVDLSRWRVALNGAEAVAPSVLRLFTKRFQRWGFRREALTPVYGLSEAALAVTFGDLERPFSTRRFLRRSLSDRGEAVEDVAGVELVSVGSSLPGFEVSIRDPAGKVLRSRRVGRIWVTGPSLMEGYLGLPDETRAVLQDGWLDTGDQGFLYDGELFLTGRAKDIIVLRGRNHSPVEIEQVAEQQPGVRKGCSAAVSCLTDGSAREQLLLFVERSQNATPEEIQNIPENCHREVVAQTGLAFDAVFVLDPGALPRTSSGKIRRQTTAHRHLLGELNPPLPVTKLGLIKVIAASLGAIFHLNRSRPE